MEEIKEESIIEIKEQPIIGKFKTKEKFIEFVGGRGNINFLAKEALIQSKYLSGSLSKPVTFKLTICDEGTVDFDEVDTDITTFDERQRLLDILCEKSITPGRIKNYMIVSDVTFTSTQKIQDKTIYLFLAVDYKTPIKKLASLFDDDIEVTEDQESKLDKLFSMFDDEPESKLTIIDEVLPEKQIEESEIPKNEITSLNKINDDFKKMKEEKVLELKKRIEQQDKELHNSQSNLKSINKRIDDIENELTLLNSRLDTMVPIEDPNGYLFFVSHELNQKIELPDDIANIIKDKVSKIKSINSEAFMKLFEAGEYQIRIGKLEGENIVEVKLTDNEKSGDFITELPPEVAKTLFEIDKKCPITAKESNGEIILVYKGELKWHDLVKKMIKSGFQQSSEFDKMCGSSSFGSTEEQVNVYQPRS